MGGFRRAHAHACAPAFSAQFYYICIQFLGKIWLNNRLPLNVWEILDPPLQVNGRVDRPVADPGRGRFRPKDQNFLDFTQFLGKSGNFVFWRPLLRRMLDPPRRHFPDTSPSLKIYSFDSKR